MHGAVVEHIFKVGQKVRLKRVMVTSVNKGSDYQVIALLPSNGTHNQYRVKCTSGFEERVVTEIELILP